MKLDDLLDGLPRQLEPFALPQAEIDEAIERLASSWTAESLALDPYWPKWDSPWWYMTLLYELGLAAQIPPAALTAMADAIDRHYLHDFPFRLDELPASVDPLMQIMCPCGVGTIYSVLTAGGLNVDERLPWMRPWFVRYQLPDGGLNCEEAAYLRETPHSSLVSTLPPLEAVMLHAPAPTPEEEAFLARGAAYLLERQLHISKSTGEVINEDWLIPTFPRFYEYDVLRALQFVTRWAETRQQKLSVASIQASVAALRNSLIDTPRRHPQGGTLSQNGQLRLGRSFALEELTRFWMNGEWHPGFPATTFPLLETLSRAGDVSPFLTRSWLEAAENLRRLDQQGLLI